MVEMSYTAKERRKKEIAESIKRGKLVKEMKLGLAFDTREGRKRQTGILEVFSSEL